MHGGQLEAALGAKYSDPNTRQEAARMEARFIAQTGVMVPKVAARIDAGLAGKDPAKLVPAALIFAEIAERSPKLADPRASILNTSRREYR